MVNVRVKKYTEAFGWLATALSVLGGFIGMIATLAQSKDELWTDGMHVNAMNWLHFTIMLIIFLPGATVTLVRVIEYNRD